MPAVPAALLCAGLMIVPMSGCREAGRAPAAREESLSHPPISEVIAAHADSLMALPGVVGVYEGRLEDGTPCVKVMVLRLDKAVRARLPRTLQGHPVTIVETGEIRAMPGER